MSLVRAMVGREPETAHAYMTRRERVDFIILTINFGALVGAYVQLYIHLTFAHCHIHA